MESSAHWPWFWTKRALARLRGLMAGAVEAAVRRRRDSRFSIGEESGLRATMLAAAPSFDRRPFARGAFLAQLHGNTFIDQPIHCPNSHLRPRVRGSTSIQTGIIARECCEHNDYLKCDRFSH